MEPPSRQLLDLLSQYGLATPADLRRCRSHVRRLAHDLPTFDSVWIDALTQAKVITPFQARLLESDHPQALRVGPCLLVEEWERDGRWTLRLARHRDSRQKCLLTFIELPVHDRPRALQQCREVIGRLRGMSHSSVVVPQGCDETEAGIVVVSPYATGPTLKQLLVRRGRFPIPVVMDIAWSLIDGLAALEKRDVVHGDVTLTNVRLTARGHVVTLHPGVLPAVGSRVSIHAPFGPDNYDGTAPELINSSRAATPQSDLYALGCLLWQLLAGRPPYPSGDSLAKLAAHQTKSIDDVRRWVPDAPAEFAALLRQLTDKNPARRGTGAREIRDQWPLSNRFGRSRLVQFHSSFGHVAPRHGDIHRSASRFPGKTAAAMLFVLSGLSLSLLDAGARNELLRLAGRPSSAMTDQPDSPALTGSEEDTQIATDRPAHLLSFPTRPINGVIELSSPGPYAAADVQVDGPLLIRGRDGVTPRVVITSQPLRIAAGQLRLENVHLAFEGDHSSATALLTVRSQRLALIQCRFDGSETHQRQDSSFFDPARLPTAVAWKVTDPANPTEGTLLMRNSIVSGPLHGIETHSMPRSLGFDNCLKLGPGGLVRIAHGGSAIPLKIHLRQTTLRDSGGAVRWSSSSATDTLQPLLLIAENSVFDGADDRAAFLEFEDQPKPGWEGMIRITGEGSLLRVGTQLASATPHPGRPARSLDATQLRVEGLLIDEFEFAADDVDGPEASVIALSLAPRSTPTPPGIDADRLRTSTPVVRQVARP